MKFTPSTFLLVLLLLTPVPVAADSLALAPAKDNTLIQRTDPGAQYSNGLGDIFTGRTNQDGQGTATSSIRRGLVQFDLASIPAGSTITGATLTMQDVMGLNGNPTVSLHRVLADWGEGTSFQSGGQGAPATQDDATWLYRFYDTADPASSPAWSSPGGDFEVAASASAIITSGPSGQSFDWSSADVISDVQFWLDNPTANFGWILLGDESQGQTAKRFSSSDSLTPPQLLVSYVVPEPTSLVLLGTAIVALAAVYRRHC